MRWETAASIMNVIIGSGLLAFPFAMKTSGAVLGVIILIIVGFVSWCTALLLAWALQASEPEMDARSIPHGERSYGALVQVAFGDLGGALIICIIAMDVWLGAQSNLIYIGMSMNLVCGISKTMAILLTSVITLYTCYFSMKSFAYLSVISILAICVGFGALVWSGLILPSNGPSFDSFHVATRWEGFTSAVGLSLYCFGGHPDMPSIFSGMKNARKDVSFALSMAFAVACLTYVFVGAVGYYFFGDFLKQSFVSNIGMDLRGQALPGYGFLSAMVAVLFSIKLQGALPLMIVPLLAVFEPNLLGDRRSDVTLMFRVCVLAACALPAISCQDQVAALNAFCGSFLVMFSSVILPIVMYLKVVDRIGLPLRALLIFIVTCSAALGLYGTEASARKLFHKLHE